MMIKDFYLEKYPTDELGLELNSDATFLGLLKALVKGEDVYDYMGVYDSLVRERMFTKLAENCETSYDWVYNLWLN